MTTHDSTTKTTTTTRPGDALPARTCQITREDLRRYADAAGDHNPIHLNDEAARALGLPGVVAVMVVHLSSMRDMEWQ